jgi:hypothetical protein
MQIVNQGNAFNNPSKIDYIGAKESPLVEEKRIHENAIPSLTNLEDTVAIHCFDAFKGQKLNSCVSKITRDREHMIGVDQWLS